MLKKFSKIVDNKKDYITIDLKRFLGEEKEIQFKILSMAFKNQLGLKRTIRQGQKNFECCESDPIF